MGLRDFLNRSPVNKHEAKIGGKTFTFYPIRVGAVLRAQSVVQHIARAVVAAFDPNEGQYQKQVVTRLAGEEDNDTQVVTEPVSEAHASSRIKRRQIVVDKAVESLLSEESGQKLAALVLDSLREDEVTAQEFVDATEAPDFIAFVKGMLLANAPSVLPLVDKALRKLDADVPLALVKQEPEEE